MADLVRKRRGGVDCRGVDDTGVEAVGLPGQAVFKVVGHKADRDVIAVFDGELLKPLENAVGDLLVLQGVFRQVEQAAALDGQSVVGQRVARAQQPVHGLPALGRLLHVPLPERNADGHEQHGQRAHLRKVRLCHIVIAAGADAKLCMACRERRAVQKKIKRFRIRKRFVRRAGQGVLRRLHGQNGILGRFQKAAEDRRGLARCKLGDGGVKRALRVVCGKAQSLIDLEPAPHRLRRQGRMIVVVQIVQLARAVEGIFAADGRKAAGFLGLGIVIWQLCGSVGRGGGRTGHVLRTEVAGEVLTQGEGELRLAERLTRFVAGADGHAPGLHAGQLQTRRALGERGRVGKRC